jgi:hypothetical protein
MALAPDTADLEIQDRRNGPLRELGIHARLSD